MGFPDEETLELLGDIGHSSMSIVIKIHHISRRTAGLVPAMRSSGPPLKSVPMLDENFRYVTVTKPSGESVLNVTGHMSQRVPN